jgi:hypothetical protein
MEQADSAAAATLVKCPRRRFQYSLRMIFVVTAVAAVCFTCLRFQLDFQARQEREWEAALQAAGQQHIMIGRYRESTKP